jgi:hypothetical protein
MSVCYSKIRAYKYRLEEGGYQHRTEFRPEKSVHVDDWVRLLPDGTLSFRPGYCWDGPSGPTIDTPNWMRASLVHDGLYQMLRAGLLAGVPFRDGFTPEDPRLYADKLMRRILLADGMSKLRANMSYRGVRWFAGFAAKPKPAKQIICA